MQSYSTTDASVTESSTEIKCIPFDPRVCLFVLHVQTQEIIAQANMYSVMVVECSVILSLSFAMHEAH